MQVYKLTYSNPANKHEETLPIGNGSLGGMVFGGVEQERIGLNHDRLWSGVDVLPTTERKQQCLMQARNLIFESKYSEAERLIEKELLGEYTESYLPLGDLYLNFKHRGFISNYKRELNLNEGMVYINYQIDDVTYCREYFSSFPHQAMFIRLSSSQNSMDFSIELRSLLQLNTMITSTTPSIAFQGQCPEHVEPSYSPVKPEVIQGKSGLKFDGKISIIYCDGIVKACEDLLSVHNASQCIIAIEAITPSTYDDSDFSSIREQHISDVKKHFERVDLYLGNQPDVDTDIRLDMLKNGLDDPALFALYFQYGRYLLLSSSRSGSLPANLQGIWSWEMRPPWSSNYTTNINLQMNYWLANSCNLQECLEPYFSFLKRLCINGKKTARDYYSCNGFVVHHNTDGWAKTNPVGRFRGEVEAHPQAATWSMWPMGGVWLCAELYKYYEYTNDKLFLEETAYPILQECIEFVMDWLILHDGYYTTCPSTSPENRFLYDGITSSMSTGSTLDLTLIRELLRDYKKVCEILEIDDPRIEEICTIENQLAPFKIGSKGQLLEWDYEFEECEKGHRHLSHLYGIFPSNIFIGNQEIVEACKISLIERLKHGSGHTGWSCAWIVNIFATLGDSIKTYEYLHMLLTNSTYPNLWDAHPPFQIDGNFGGSAGIANMLVQERNGVILLLPALPESWSSGYVTGLRIKHNKTVSIRWENGEVVEHSIEDIV